MNLAEFVERRGPAWRELEDRLRSAEEGEGAALGHEGARRLVDLYRRVASDLVQARTLGAGVEVTAYLEALAGRGYAFLYQAPPLSARRAVWRFLRERFPRAVRREAAAFWIVVACFSGGAALGGAATALDPEAARLFVPAEHQTTTPSERVRRDEEAQRDGGRMDPAGHAAFSSFLFTHNIGVSITAFAVGVAWGLPTLLLEAYHGVFIAALAVEYFRDGQGLFFLAWVLPHGVVELTCIFLAGAAGLMLGRGVLWPRGRSRGERLREEAKGALEILGGTAALLVVAGVIEGTLSQIHEPALPYGLKIAFAAVLGGLLQAYLWLLPLPPSPHAAPRDLSSR